MSNKTIVVIGTGYVGLPAAIMLANSGYTVIGVDIDKNVVEAINNGHMHIDEQELKDLLIHDNVKRNLKAQGVPCEADVFIIAVPTPLDVRKKVANLDYVESAMESILPYLRKGNLVIIESTIPPMTCRGMIIPMVEHAGFSADSDILIAHCPERILPGEIFHEIVNNDRIIGGINAASSEAAREVYASFVKGEFFITNDITAELCKLMENTYRDVNIALANEFSLVGEVLDVDIREAIDVANKHPRVNILMPGIGVGGHCIPIDPWFIKEVSPDNSSLIFCARRINDEMPYRVASKIRKSVCDVSDPKIVAVGATYKPNTYDLRESPALRVCQILKEEGYDVDIIDPIAEEYPYSSLQSIAKGVDCLAILVEHDVVKNELAGEIERIESVMRTPIILRF